LVAHISHRLTRNIGLGALIVIIAVMGGSGFFLAKRLDNQLVQLEGFRQNLEVADHLLGQFLEIRGHLTVQIIEENTDISFLMKQIKQLQEQTASYSENLDDLQSKQHLSGFQKKIGQFRMATVAYFQELEAGSEGEGIQTWGTTLIQIEQQAHTLGNELKVSFRNQIRQQDESISELAAATKGLVSSFGIIGVILAITIALLLRWALSRPIHNLLQAASAVADGDLTLEAPTDLDDELGTLAAAINEMIYSLQRTVQRISETVAEVDQTAGALDRLSRDGSNNAEKQDQDTSNATRKILEMEEIVSQVGSKVESLARSLSESTSSTEEMVATIHEVSELSNRMTTEVEGMTSSLFQMHNHIGQNLEFLDFLQQSSLQVRGAAEALTESSRNVFSNASDTAELAEQVSVLANHDGHQALASVSSEISQNREQISHYREMMHSLGDKSENIGEILIVMRSVAEQTNLLALNAAIIAAQAGEQGKSFAVVADEIRKLSETTSGQIRKIDEVIDTVRNDLGLAVKMVDEISQGADASLASVGQCRNTFEQIATTSVDSKNRAQSIANAASSQEQKSLEIKREAGQNADQVEKIYSMVEEQKKSSEHIVQAVEELKAIAERLNQGTREQAEGSTIINRTLQETLVFSQEINQAMSQEKEATRVVVESLQQISDVAGKNLSAMNHLQETVERLQSLAAEILPETARFRLPEP